MPKENIRKVLGVTAAVFARMGQLSPEEAREMSGLDQQAFDEAMHKARKAEDELKAAKKEPSFYDIVSKAADEYMNAVKKIESAPRSWNDTPSRTPRQRNRSRGQRPLRTTTCAPGPHGLSGAHPLRDATSWLSSMCSEYPLNCLLPRNANSCIQAQDTRNAGGGLPQGGLQALPHERVP